MTTATKSITEQKSDELREALKDAEVGAIERLTQVRLSDFIRQGSTVTEKAEGWGTGESACALHAGIIGAHAAGWIV